MPKPPGNQEPKSVQLKPPSPLSVFTKPNNTVQGAVKSPKPALAIIFIIVAWLLGVAAVLLLGAELDATTAGLVLAYDAIVFFLFCALVLLAAKAAKSRANFSGIITAYGLTKLVETAAIIIVAAIALLALGPAEVLQGLVAGKITEQQLIAGFDDTSIVNLAVLVVGALVVAIWFSLLRLYIAFLAIYKSTKLSVFKSIILLIAFSLITGAAALYLKPVLGL